MRTVFSRSRRKLEKEKLTSSGNFWTANVPIHTVRQTLYKSIIKNMLKKKKKVMAYLAQMKNTFIKNAGSCFPIKLLKDCAELILPAVEATDAGLPSVPARA